jgi:hypothetical protein
LKEARFARAYHRDGSSFFISIYFFFQAGLRGKCQRWGWGDLLAGGIVSDVGLVLEELEQSLEFFGRDEKLQVGFLVDVAWVTFPAAN